MFYLVTQTPKRRYRGALNTSAMIVDAKSSAEAVRLAIQHGGSENWFAASPDFNKPTASLLQLNKPFCC